MCTGFIIFIRLLFPTCSQGVGGRCVTITSGARNGSPNQVPYSVSKGAVYSFIGALGNAYCKDGVFVNGVEPGRALTEMVVPRFSPEFIASPPGQAMGRYSDPEEVAEVIEFLCSERNTYTTGSVWSVKEGEDSFGGLTLRHKVTKKGKARYKRVGTGATRGYHRMCPRR